ncbi:hypothetical protein [Solirubrobacter soli]|uniref:hypothetical protein n=1 Tax=Solirubrobacter soli TaxID=363832 RepID=UPI00055FDE94|nr:hypothetical protein [Solirubrobacter soli]
MSFYVSHRMGSVDPDPPFASLNGLLDELDEEPDDAEHFSVAVPHHPEHVLTAAAEGNLELLQSQPSKPGYDPAAT